MNLEYLVRNMRSAMPDSIWVGGRTLPKLLLTPIFDGDDYNPEVERLYFHDTKVGSVRLVIDLQGDYKPDLIALGNLSFALRTFFDKQRSHANLSLIQSRPLRISTLSGKPVAAVCPVCHNASLTIYAYFIAPIPDSLTGEVAVGDSLLIQELGCANYEVDKDTPLTARGALHTAKCFTYNLYGNDTQVHMNNQFEVAKSRALVNGLGAWANLLTGICRAGEGVL